MMKRFEFSIIASGPDPPAPDFETRFLDAGCDDATVSFQRGHIVIDFARRAATIEAAVSSAVGAVRKAGATVERIEPDPLVSLADMAARTGMSRAAMTQYSKGQRGKRFPPPVARVTSESPLWDWASVARWLFRLNKLRREEVLEAVALREANEVISRGERQFAVKLQKRMESRSKEL